MSLDAKLRYYFKHESANSKREVLIFVRTFRQHMSHNKIIPTGRQKGIFFLHFAVYAVAVIAMIMIHVGQEKAAHGWVYPWHAWLIAAWGLAVVGHMCALWTSYEDPGMTEYERQTQNG